MCMGKEDNRNVTHPDPTGKETRKNTLYNRHRMGTQGRERESWKRNPVPHGSSERRFMVSVVWVSFVAVWGQAHTEGMQEQEQDTPLM